MGKFQFNVDETSHEVYNGIVKIDIQGLLTILYN